MAKREGMVVDVFSVGFGKPIFQWNMGGVKWQICPILFGGYVKISGMDNENGVEPKDILGGFYSKSPMSRMRVALAGPLANFVLAIVLFSCIWIAGGRAKPFSQFTQIIGQMDTSSDLYKKGIRPGDTIVEYNDSPFEGFKDLIYAALTNGHSADIEGVRVDYETQKRIPFEFTITPYTSPKIGNGLHTIGVLSPANYLIYRSPVKVDLPISSSNIGINDRILWANGEIVFSTGHLEQMINSKSGFMVTERNGKKIFTSIPCISIEDMQFTDTERLDLEDGFYNANFYKRKQKYFIPYTIAPDMTVLRSVSYVDEMSNILHPETVKNEHSYSSFLSPGDRIISVNGVAVNSPAEMISVLQSPSACLIVKRGSDYTPKSWKHEDNKFLSHEDIAGINLVCQEILNGYPLTENHRYYAVSPINLVKREHVLPDEMVGRDQLILGAVLSDKLVLYNPDPLSLFASVCRDIFKNIKALISKNFVSTSKHLAGAVMVVKIMQHSWIIGIKEALFWIGAISINLGWINLLPIPVLDGGHLLFSGIEAVRKKPLSPKLIKTISIPFLAILFLLMIYIMYNDIVRIIQNLF